MRPADAQLLDGIDLTVRAGRRLVVLGPNGAGKSLLLRICHGLIAPSRGAGRLDAAGVGGAGAGDGVPAAGAAAPVGARQPRARLVACGASASVFAGRAPMRRWRGSGWRPWPGSRRGGCREASSSAWRWRGPGRCDRRYCFSTSRRAQLDPGGHREHRGDDPADGGRGGDGGDDDARPRPGASAGGRRGVPAPGPAGGGAAAAAFFAAPVSAEAQTFLAGDLPW